MAESVESGAENRRSLVVAWRRLRWVAGLCTTVLSSGACSEVERPIPTIQVHTWWQLPEENAAWADLEREHERTHPVDLVANAPTEKNPIRVTIAKDVLSGAPSGTFLANLGADLYNWTRVDISYGGQPPRTERYSFLRSDLVEALDARGGLGSSFKREVWPELLRWTHVSPLRELCEGAECQAHPLIGIPINIHRLNVLYYRPDRFPNGPPQLDDLCPDGKAPEELGVAVDAGGFPVQLLFFENLFLAFLRRASQTDAEAAERYIDFFAGPKAQLDGDSPSEVDTEEGDWEAPAREALLCLSRMHLKLADSWSDQVLAVESGEASLTAMGDWANAVLRMAMSAGKVALSPFPGTEDFFVFTSDTFPLPIGTRFEEETEDLMATFANPVRQRRFSSLKGSLPALGLGPRVKGFNKADCPARLWPEEDRPSSSGLDEARCNTLRDLHERLPLLATSGLSSFSSEGLPEKLLDVAVEEPESVEAMITWLREARQEFADFQSRLRLPTTEWQPGIRKR